MSRPRHPADDAAIARMRRSGMTYMSIGAAVGLSPMAVYNRLRKRGLAWGRAGSLSPPWVARAADMRRCGMSLRQIGAAIGLSHVAVWKQLDKLPAFRAPL